MLAKDLTENGPKIGIIQEMNRRFKKEIVLGGFTRQTVEDKLDIKWYFEDPFVPGLGYITARFVSDICNWLNLNIDYFLCLDKRVDSNEIRRIAEIKEWINENCPINC